MLDSTQTQKAEIQGQVSVEDRVLFPVTKKIVHYENSDHLYEMIKDGDVGTLLPSTEDPVAEVHPLVLVGADLTGSYLNDGHDENNGGGFMDQSLDEDDAEKKVEPASLQESEDLVAERNGLLAQMKVLDAMLQQIETEEQQRAISKGRLVDAGANDVTSRHVHMGDAGGGSSKRQRRPNPKYFDTEIESDFLTPRNSPSMFHSDGEELLGTVNGSDGQPLQGPGNEITPSVSRTTLTSFLDHSSVRSAGTHRTRTALAQKARVFSTLEGLAGGTDSVRGDNYLDNLSIRELHDAYKNTFGRDTSVKDKHWLKRQISMGSSKQSVVSVGKETGGVNPCLPETTVKTRPEKYSSAEVPLSFFGSTDINTVNTVSHGNANETKRSHRKMLSLAVLSPSGPSTTGDCIGNIDGSNNNVDRTDIQITGSPGGGKRLRKPNRRYIEDEGNGGLGVGSNRTRSILSSYLSSGNGLPSGPLRLSWRSDPEVLGDAGYRNSALRSTGIRASARSNACHGRRSKHGSNGMKRKNDVRAAKLVKMAQSVRLVGNDSDGTVQKVKFRLPAAPGQEKGEVVNGDNEQHVSCLLPVLMDESSEDYQTLSSHYLSRLEESNDQGVVTVPTANGGTRRKHHRPWTLREVVTLVEGVARCGGGKWADIKKLVFSTVGYRTAVDLKDKWRNLLRASRAQLHPTKPGETRKKQFSASIPGHVLAKVRELAALNNQIVPPASAVASCTSRSGRTVHRR